MNLPIFKITVEQSAVEAIPDSAEWAQIGVGVEGANSAGYGYTPPIEKRQKVSRIIYEQTVERLDLKSLVSVVNEIERHN